MANPFARFRRSARNEQLRHAKARVAAEAGQGGAFAEEIERCGRLSEFIKAAWHVIEPGTEYIHGWHIDAMADHLEAVTRGECKRLLINIPPRYMKSITVSVMWPIWEWTRSPHTRFMFATYSGSLSAEHSRSRLAILQSDWFRDRWGNKVQLTKANEDLAMNSARGTYEATSFTGTATGKGANRLVIDDPHNTKKADSDVERAATIRLFNTTFQSRLNDKKRDAIVVVMQRLHEEDVSARCLQLGYTHLCLPAEAEGRTVISLPSGRVIVREKGDLLWPEREGRAELDAMHAALLDYGYAGQYQQRPAPAGGGIFKDFPIVDAVPAKAKRVRYWDKAGTEGGGAYSAGVKMLEADGIYYIEHVIRGQWSAYNREKVIKTTAETDGRHVHVWTEQEPGSGGKESAENTVKMLAGWVVQKEPVTGDKVARARPMAAQAEIGNVKLLRGEWNQAFIDEARSFPNGKYKDQIDAASGAFNKLVLAPRPGKTVAAPAQASPPVRRLGAPEHPGGIPSALGGF